MRLVNETKQEVYYDIRGGTHADCGKIQVNGLVNLPQYDNLATVIVKFFPIDSTDFMINLKNTVPGQKVVMLAQPE